MVSSGACASEKSFVEACNLPYKLDMKMFGGQKGSVLGSSDRREGVLADLGLTLTSSTMEANSLKKHSIISKASSVFTHANPANMKGSKRPDKALSCPRCNSSDTKFCYYNNYNINQPRHFCKGCQRYWTAGGTFRNVAIGAGRRKRKHTLLESDSQDSMAEDGSPVEVPGSKGGGSSKGESPHGRSQQVKPQALPVAPSPCATITNPSSLTSNEISFSDSWDRTWITRPHDKVEPLFDHHKFRDQFTTFYEYLPPKGTEAPPDKVRTLYTASHERACDGMSTEQMKAEALNFHLDLQHSSRSDVGLGLASSPSSDRQASNESGCASSVTTQTTFNADVCVAGRKQDSSDSEVTKEEDELNKGGAYCDRSSHYAHLLPSQMPISRGGTAISDFTGRHNNAPYPGTVALMKGQPEIAGVKAAWPGISPAVTWSPAADRAPLWDFPCAPTANAVDAAKAAMIPCTGSSLACQPGPHRPSEKWLWVPKTLRINDADEAARSSIWSTLGITDRRGSMLSEKAEAVVQCQGKVQGASSAPLQHTCPATTTEQSTVSQETSWNS